MRKLIYITSILVLFGAAFLLYNFIKPKSKLPVKTFIPVQTITHEITIPIQEFPDTTHIKDTIIFIDVTNTKWIGHLHIGKIFFRASKYIPSHKIHTATNTPAYNYYLTQKAPLSVGDTVWTSLPAGYFITSILDSIFFYLDDGNPERNFIEYSAKPINLPNYLSDKQYFPVLIFDTPPQNNIYSILPKDSIYKNDSLLYENISEEIYPKMSKIWIDVFHKSLDEESKKHYSDTFKYTFSKSINLFKFIHKSTAKHYTIADIKWKLTPGHGRNDFGIFFLGSILANNYKQLWSNEWYSESEVASHRIEIEDLYCDKTGRLILLLSHSGWEYSYREALMFDELTSSFTPDTSYISLY